MATLVPRGTSIEGPTKKLELTLSKMKKSSQQLEAVMLKQMLSEMRKNSMASDDSQMTGLATDIADQKLAETMAASNPHGLSQRLYDQFSKTIIGQEVARQIVDAAKNANQAKG